jgi:hypothetical protein
MILDTGMIDRDTFQHARDAFLAQVSAQEPGDRGFEDFSTGVVGTQEGYKKTVRTEALEQLNLKSWTQEMIGTGDVLRQIVASIEVSNNNLIMIEARNGPGTEGHIKLKEAFGGEVKRLETLAYRLFAQDDQSHEQLFADWVTAIGSVYPVISFLFFLKDAERYTPLRPKYLEKGLRKLGIEHRMQGRCSWQNYTSFLTILTSLRPMIADGLNIAKVDLIDAHSFVWVLGAWDAPAVGKTGMGSTLGDLEKTAWMLANRIENTVKNSSGQEVMTTRKAKNTDEALRKSVLGVLKRADGICEISGLTYELPMNKTDSDLQVSIDRIDSDGDYVADNMQATCWFINRWKSNDRQANFVRLLELVRETD